MDWSTAMVQWLHVLFGTSWFDERPYATFVVFPAVERLAPNAAQSLHRSVLKRRPSDAAWNGRAQMGDSGGSTGAPTTTMQHLATYGATSA